MKNFSFFVVALLTPSFLASNPNSSSSKSTQQCQYPNSLSNTADSLSFNFLSSELKAKILDHVPFQCTLVCREWLQMTQERRKVEYFRMLFRLEKGKGNQDVYIERHFDSERERNHVISKAIASYYDELTELVEAKEILHNDPTPLKSFTKNHIFSFLSRSQLIEILPTMSSSNPKGHLLWWWFFGNSVDGQTVSCCKGCLGR